MTIQLVIKKPDRAYLSTLLWLPRTLINRHAIKSSLEFQISVKGEAQLLQLWRETNHHLGVPREYVPKEDYEKLSFPIVDITPKEFPRHAFKSKVVLDYKNPSDDAQRRAFAAQLANDNGILNLSCGRGKTCLALHEIAARGLNTLIIVNQTTILKQWKDRIEEFLEFDGGIGAIQGDPNQWDWKRPITIATLHSLSIYQDRVTTEMRRWFGLVFWDECHHLSAPFFCVTATMFPGMRKGLSATVIREDGMEVVYNYHLGDVFHKDLRQDVKPNIFFRQLHTHLNSEERREIIDKRGQINISKLRALMGRRDDRNKQIAHDIRAAIQSGRKILALSHSKEQLRLMNGIFSADGFDCGLCTGDQEVSKRWKALSDKQLIFGTHQLILEAIDEDTLDTLVWLTPFGSQHPDGGKNALQQGMGRIQGYRHSAGERHPLVIVFDDIYVEQFHRMCNQLRKQMRRWPEDEGGPYEYKNLSAFTEQ